MAEDTQTTPNPDPLTPEEFVRELRALRARLPNPAPAPVPSRLRGRLAHVDPHFIQASVNTIGASDSVQKALGLTDEDLQQLIDTAARWSAGDDELRALTLASASANTIRRQR